MSRKWGVVLLASIVGLAVLVSPTMTFGSQREDVKEMLASRIRPRMVGERPDCGNHSREMVEKVYERIKSLGVRSK